MFAGNERVTDLGANMYDFNARMYVASFPRFTRMDPLCEKYPWLNPYAYCAGDPINLTDPTGRDIFVLHDTGLIGHMGMLIQHEDNKWYYYSINGTNVFSSGTFRGGRRFNDIEIGSWDSPEEFLQSSYNSEGGKDRKEDKSVDYYDYEEGYLIESNPEQDGVMRETFKEISTTDYNLLDNNCATTVQRVMIEANLPITPPSYSPNFKSETTIFGPVQVVSGANVKHDNIIRTLPSKAFHSIMRANPGGKYIHK